VGYSLTIGEAEFDVDRVGEDEWTETVQDEYIRVTAKTVELPDAPAFGEPTDHMNERWPSYSQWYDWCEQVGLEHIMFSIDENENVGNIRGGHPGYFPITPAFKKEVDNAYDNWKAQHPNVEATFDNFETHPENGAMCRLEWLKYWTDWSLENCKVPVFVNT
jgi:hypothetical protein